jgi:tripartite-type tricarboxylate transporter receptor subunit TctC
MSKTNPTKETAMDACKEKTTRFYSAIRGVLGSALMVYGLFAYAQQSDAWPSRPIRIVVPYAPGGGTDIMARVIGSALSRQLGQSVMVENRPGGQTIIGYTAVANSPADGYTFLINNSAHTIQPSLFKNLSYHAINDFRGVSQIAISPIVFVVGKQLPVTDLKSYAAYGREGNGRLNFGSFGTGTGSHLWGEILSDAIGVPMMHVPYRGSAPAIQDLLGGQINGLFVDPLSIKPFIQAGKVRAIGITGPHRWKGLESVPTFVEQGYPQFADVGWFGLLARTGTPDPVVQRMQEEVAKAIRTPEATAKLGELGIEPFSSTPAAFDIQIRKDVEKWAKIIAEKHITID